MKWARVKPSGPLNQQDAICFDEFPDQATLQKVMEAPENVWISYTFKPIPDFDPADGYEQFKNRYENFCGGYLLFYDDVVRNKAVDHTIYFTWTNGKDANGQYSVNIFLSPAPIQVTGNAAKSAGKSSIATQSMATDGGTVDPPPPPPPPPPKMH